MHEIHFGKFGILVDALGVPVWVHVILGWVQGINVWVGAIRVGVYGIQIWLHVILDWMCGVWVCM